MPITDDERATLLARQNAMRGEMLRLFGNWSAERVTTNVGSAKCATKCVRKFASCGRSSSASLPQIIDRRLHAAA